jgi:superfamily II RNA helicase
MVKICNNVYSKKQEEKYKQYFEKYSFPLSSFQKYAIEAIVEEQHILITAHTGSGKTLPAEFAIEYFVSRGKKVIYTSPIKALSNQKYYEFTQKFPNISFGILTGDIKSNPEADVLIMTTEILQNTLYRKKQQNNDFNDNKSLAMFDMDIDIEVGCVIFDEVHYINDPDRGKVWEETIMMLPCHIQMVMLSATLDSPDKFALWCETRIKDDKEIKKEVYLTTTNERVVPLTHYGFITTTNGIYKAIKDKDMEKQIKDFVNKPFVIQTSKGEFNEVEYSKMKKMLKLFETKNIYVKRQHVINNLCKYMVENNMFPAICFILSRKQLEICAKEVSCVLLEDDSKVPYIVRYECEQIIRKLPNYKEYLELNEYKEMVSLLEKGIAIHHAGIMPILREMVELLFSKGYIKLLFATETFAVGINMPTKTVIFTDINKFDGNNMRILYSHEFTQMAGRAGRRGIDTIGNVIHLNNLFKNVELINYKEMLKGKPQRLVSKFKISYNLLLNLIDIGDQDFLNFVKRSMIQEDIDAGLNLLYSKIKDKDREIESLEVIIKNSRTDLKIMDRYLECINTKNMVQNKKRKILEREIENITENNKSIFNDIKNYINYNEKKEDIQNILLEVNNTKEFLNSNILKIVNLLLSDGFIEKNDNLNLYILSKKGYIATHIREIHCLIFSELLNKNMLNNLSPFELISIFSCFTNISVQEELRVIKPVYNNKNIEVVMNEIFKLSEYYQDFESKEQINTGVDYNIHYDLLDSIIEWAKCDNIIKCKEILDNVERDKGIFLGEFVKAILKINNISSEMEKIVENIGNIELLSKLRVIPSLTQKFVATNQSLYV